MFFNRLPPSRYLNGAEYSELHMSEDGVTASAWSPETQSMTNGRLFCHQFDALDPKSVASVPTQAIQFSDGASAREL